MYMSKLMVIGKRANQISVEMKQDLEKRDLFYNDNALKRFLKNREQIEIYSVTMKSCLNLD